MLPLVATSRRNAPLVSVLIPSYNRSNYLAAALDSVLAQTYPNIEIVVVDDGSTDSTPQLMEGYRGRVVYHRQANGGVASARNTGLRLAHGEFFAFMDSDDICLPHRIAAQVACMRQHPDAVLCSSDFLAFDAERLIEASHIATYYNVVRTQHGGIQALYSERQILREDDLWDAKESIVVLTGLIYERLIGGNFIHPPTVMVRRSAVETVGDFDVSIAIATEYDWLLRASRLGPIAYLDTPLLKYRYSGEQLSSPDHWAQIALDTIKTIDKLRQIDIKLYRHWQRRLERRIGVCYLAAADASLELSKLRAAGQLLDSILHGVVSNASLKVLLKLLVPRAALQLYRSARSANSERVKDRTK